MNPPSNPRVLAVVPARAGSKRLPGKNTRLLAGRSLVSWAVDCARSSPLIDSVVVTTDDESILVEDREDALYLRRPTELCSDDASTIDVIRDVMRRTVQPSIVVLLQPTSPLRTVEDVDRCIKLLLDDESCDSSATVSEIDHPIAWILEQSPDGLRPLRGWESLRARSQEHAPAYRLNGAVYAIRASQLLVGAEFVGPTTRFVEIPAARGLDIDTELDFLVAEAQVQLQHRVKGEDQA